MIEMLMNYISFHYLQFRDKMKKLVSFFFRCSVYNIFCNLSKTLIWKTKIAYTTTNGQVCISSGNKSVIYKGSSVENISNEKGNASNYKQFIKQDT